MSLCKRIFFALAIAGAVVGVASWLGASASECFYLLVPPTALALFLTGVDNVRKAVETRVRPLFVIFGCLFIVGLVVANQFFGPAAMLSWRFWIEAATYLYYFGSMLIVLLAIRRSILGCAKAAQERWQFSPGVRILLCEALPLALFVFFALPLGMAFAQVHRFKMPNFANPKTFWDREYEKIEFQSADGTLLRGWWIPAKTLTPDPSPRGRGEKCPRTLVICHGVAANRSIFLPFVAVGDWLDANVLMFDLRGHGDSGGHTVTMGYREKDDVLAAVAWARRERPDQARQVIGMGISLGAASLAEATARAEPPLDAVILDTCFTSTREMTHSAVGAFPRGMHPWLLTLGLPLADWHAGCAMMDVCPEASIAQLRSPVLFLHSKGDPIIPSEHSLRLYEKACEPKRLVVFELPGHCDAFFAQHERYRAEVVAFRERVTSRER